MAPVRKSSRSKRKRVQQPQPSQSHINPAYYVGYVEDLETVDMIMKKFEKLEEIEKNNSAAADDSKRDATDTDKPSNSSSSLTETDLMEVFKQTSSFTVEAAVREGEGYDEEFGYDPYDEDGWGRSGITTWEREDGEQLFLFGDGTDAELWEEVFGKKSKRKARSAGPRKPSENRGVTQVAFVSDMRGQYVTALKKVRKVDPNAIAYQRIPNEPLPLSWAKFIHPYVPKHLRQHFHTTWKQGMVISRDETHLVGSPTVDVTYLETTDMLQVDLTQVAKDRGSDFQGLFLDPPWKSQAQLPGDGDDGAHNGIEPEDLLRLNLKSREILQSGFVFIWTPKHLLSRVLSALEKMDFHYVENAVYVKQDVNNSMASQDSRYFRRSKETLLICRRGIRSEKNGKITWEKVEIRHQRTSDVFMGFIKEDPRTRRQLNPASYVHNMVETMLPHGRFNNPASLADSPQEQEQTADDKKPARTSGRLLHLWAPPGMQRTGWTMIAQVPAEDEHPR